ncbi:uncharacterized protein LOC133484670 isoform X1 [Phyllopteryx taeniolatus]|uniref:uncharacterized protein LOC133484670 isoform X1 n=1 Tax=Phyllopteryx taeniolatus TaxID=161469 RepID=UPI002AD4EF58|nr:uncharacterized protein LOC133484670 isoform X1 [Phyllopteryx taeniolatus]
MSGFTCWITAKTAFDVHSGVKFLPRCQVKSGSALASEDGSPSPALNNNNKRKRRHANWVLPRKRFRRYTLLYSRIGASCVFQDQFKGCLGMMSRCDLDEASLKTCSQSMIRLLGLLPSSPVWLPLSCSCRHKDKSQLHQPFLHGDPAKLPHHTSWHSSLLLCSAYKETQQNLWHSLPSLGSVRRRRRQRRRIIILFLSTLFPVAAADVLNLLTASGSKRTARRAAGNF